MKDWSRMVYKQGRRIRLREHARSGIEVRDDDDGEMVATRKRRPQKAIPDADRSRFAPLLDQCHDFVGTLVLESGCYGASPIRRSILHDVRMASDMTYMAGHLNIIDPPKGRTQWPAGAGEPSADVTSPQVSSAQVPRVVVFRAKVVMYKRLSNGTHAYGLRDVRRPHCDIADAAKRHEEAFGTGAHD